jgi:plastocyanin
MAPLFQPDGQAQLGGAQAVTVEAGDFYFKPNSLTIRRGTRARLQVVNVSTEPHTLELPSLGVHLTIPTGGTETVELRPLASGTYYFWCDLPGQADAGMVGRLVVT